MMRIHRWAVLVTLLALVVAAPSARGLTITFNGPTTVAAGSTFAWDVLATDVFAGRPAGDEVVAFGLDVTVDQPLLAAFLGATVGPLFDDTSALTPGTNVSGLVLPVDASIGEPLLLATLTFQVLNAGMLNLGVLSDISPSLNEGLFYLEDLFVADITASREVTVVSSTVASPASHTLVALALGFFTLTMMRRRRVNTLKETD